MAGNEACSQLASSLRTLSAPGLAVLYFSPGCGEEYWDIFKSIADDMEADKKSPNFGLVTFDNQVEPQVPGPKAKTVEAVGTNATSYSSTDYGRQVKMVHGDVSATKLVSRGTTTGTSTDQEKPRDQEPLSAQLEASLEVPVVDLLEVQSLSNKPLPAMGRRLPYRHRPQTNQLALNNISGSIPTCILEGSGDLLLGLVGQCRGASVRPTIRWYRNPVQASSDESSRVKQISFEDYLGPSNKTELQSWVAAQMGARGRFSSKSSLTRSVTVVDHESYREEEEEETEEDTPNGVSEQVVSTQQSLMDGPTQPPQ